MGNQLRRRGLRAAPGTPHEVPDHSRDLILGLAQVGFLAAGLGSPIAGASIAVSAGAGLAAAVASALCAQGVALAVAMGALKVLEKTSLPEV